jgi:excisionase family DNA binding protein
MSEDAPRQSQFDLLTTNEACAFLRIGVSTLYKLVRLGEIKKVTLRPKAIRFQRRELERYVARCERKG